MNVRQKTETNERKTLCELATFSDSSKGRALSESECVVRTCFARDRDRIIHSKAFRRLKHKTQVFYSPEGDHYRERMTHTLEVAQIARSIARGTALNEDLAEAAALGHDLGHSPFGHSGEQALNQACPLGFKHNEQSLRVVDIIENQGKGLNLTAEVRDGILRHTGNTPAFTQEGRIIHYADRIAYINHDIDDCIRAGIIKQTDLPSNVRNTLGDRYSQRVNTLVMAVIEYFEKEKQIGMVKNVADAMLEARAFLFEKAYTNPSAKSEEGKSIEIVKRLYEYYVKNISKMPEEYVRIAEKCGNERAVCDYVSGMTDRFAVSAFSDLFIPKSWSFY